MQDDQGNSEGELPEDSGPDRAGVDRADEPGAGFSPPDSGSSAGPAYSMPGPGYSTPEPGYGTPGHGAPSYGDPASGIPGYGQPGTSPAWGAGYGPPGPGYGAPSGYPGPGYPAGYGQAGYGTGYGQAGYLPQAGSKARRRRAFLTYLTVAVVAAAVGAGLTGYVLKSNQSSVPTASGAGRNGGSGPGLLPGGTGTGAGGQSVSGAAERAAVNAVRPGMVDISSNLRYQGSQAAATGMVISSDGLVLTNNHVINGTTDLFATLLSNGHKYQARWIGYDATDDVAVIKLIGAHNLKTVPLGDSGGVRVGDRVIAIGNAYGAERNPAYVGSITGLNRTITASDSGAATKETLHGMLQTNAGIVQGDSGGPLVSATGGKVIGMDTAAATGSFGATTQSVGFAIPIDRALRIAHQIISGQPSPTIQIGSSGFMGVLVPAGAASLPTNPKQQRQRQLKEDQGAAGVTVPPASSACLPTDLGAGVPAKVAPVTSGALIIGELCGTPADKAGIIAGDVITKVGGQAVTSPKQLTTVMLGFRAGMSVTITWVDIHGQQHNAKLPLIAAPPH